MDNYICITCGNEYAATESPPPACPTCEDERQYVRPEGQAWTTLGEMAPGSRNRMKPLEPGLTQIVTDPKFAIGQRALLIQAPGGNVLWDCLSLIDDETVAAVHSLGGISALALSHPHMFGSMVEWSHAFGHPPIHLHASYREWVRRPDPVIRFWDGDRLDLDQGVSLHRCGGHFEGSTVLLWPEGADGRGALLTSDTLHVTPDRRHVGFMYSFPNYIPLSPSTVDAVVGRVMPLEFDRVYSHFNNLEILSGAKEAIRRSVERHRRAVQ
jgi:glyoxylase-like metal-dependent hydrolase (beta-lactamase superfamily II)